MSAEVVRQNGTWPRAAPVVAALGVLCVYLPSVLRRSAWSDDYPILFETVEFSWKLFLLTNYF